MSDVLKSATKYQTRLKAELSKVEEFLRMAEEFSTADADGDDTMVFAKPAANTRPATPAAASSSTAEQPPIELARRNGNGAAAST